MKFLGAPIIGDELYGSRKARRTPYGLMLHAYKLRIRLPDASAHCICAVEVLPRILRIFGVEPDRLEWQSLFPEKRTEAGKTASAIFLLPRFIQMRLYRFPRHTAQLFLDGALVLHHGRGRHAAPLSPRAVVDRGPVIAKLS